MKPQILKFMHGKFLGMMIPFVLSSVLLAVFLFVSNIMNNEINLINKNRLLTKFAVEAASILRLTEGSFDSYSHLLESSRGLFDSSDDVTRSEWSEYFNSLKIQSSYPSLSALQFVRRVKRPEKLAFITKVRTDASVAGGYPSFTIFPEIDDDEYYVVDYIEPYKGNEAAFGFNLLSNTARKQAMEIARDSNAVVMTEPLVIVQEKNGQKSILMMIPVYEKDAKVDTLDQRRSAIKGFIIATVRAPDLFSSVVLSSPLFNIKGLSVTDVTSGSSALLPYIDTNGTLNSSSNNVFEIQKSRLSMGTRIWEISFKSDKTVELSSLEMALPYLLMTLGIVISVLTFLIVSNAQKLQSKAESIARDLTKDLEKFRLAVEYSSDMIVITDSQGIVMYANKAVEGMTGFTQKEAIGKKAGSKDLWGGQMSNDLYTNLWKQISIDKKPFIGEFTNRRKNGVDYIAQSYISPIFNHLNEVIFYVGIERDITKAKEVDRAKTEFISLASHQLRTPPSIIKWSMELLQKSNKFAPTDDQKTLVTNILVANDRMIQLVKSLLNVSRLELGSFSVNPTPVDLHEAIKGLLLQFSEQIKKKSLQIEEAYGKDIPILTTDRGLMETIIQNLISNAIKYSLPEKDVKITTELQEKNVLIAVSDSGCGIPQSEQNKIFTKLYRAANAQSMDPDGNGLGLYLVKSIVEYMGGKIWFKSIENSGTTFYVLLPIKPLEKKEGTTKISV